MTSNPFAPTQTHDTTVDFDAKRNAFVIASPPWQVARDRGLPSRRWIKKDRVWRAPALRANAEYIRLNYRTAKFTPAAMAALTAASEVKGAVHFAEAPVYSYKTQPLAHQQEGGRFIYPLRNAALFMGPGTGKTKVLIDDVNAHSAQGRVNAAVVVCPYSIRRNWAMKELPKHSFIEPRVLMLDPLTTKASQYALDAFISEHKGGVDWLVVGVESLSQGGARKHVERFMLARNAALLVDESSRIKTHDSNRTEAVQDLGKIAALRRLATGTAVTQGIEDLYAQFECLDPAIIGIGDFFSFRNRYCVMGGFNNKQIIGYDHTEELMDLIRPYTYQRLTDEVLDLPPKEPEVRRVRLTAEQKRLNHSIAHDLAEVDGRVIKVQNCLERALRWQQVTDGFYTYTVPDALNPKKQRVITEDVPGACPKLEELLAVCEENRGMKGVIWTPYRHTIKRIARVLRDRYGQESVVEFYGDIEEAQRWKNHDAFEYKDALYFVGNPAAGGIGIDLIAAHWEAWYSNTGSYENREQSEWRTRRIGQTKNVKSIDIVGEDSVDEDIQDALLRKQSLADYVAERIAQGQTPFKHIDVNTGDVLPSAPQGRAP